ncbi:TPA_asm: M [Cuscuta gammacytorhabdovirus 1]|nr:TPA_asm: M [Cuscuta gammacytorhabdovirus 1]
MAHFQNTLLSRTDRETSLNHYYLSVKGDIKVTGLRYTTVEEIYTLLEGEFEAEESAQVRDMVDLTIWAIDQNIPCHVYEELNHSPFFGPLSPTTHLIPPDPFLVMTDRTSFPTSVTRGRLSREGTWNLRGEEFKLVVSLDFEIKSLIVNDTYVDISSLSGKYVRSDFYNWRYHMGRGSRLLEAAGSSDKGSSDCSF